MVSFWPFGGEDNSAASFEKALSQLSEKINTTTSRADRFKHRQRKYKALWTIYTVFGYILIDIILILVTGWDKWGPFEWTIVSGGPLGIYVVRMALHAYYDARLSAVQDYLADLIKQREDTLEKLKATTKYNSTQKLLDKYGGSTNSKRLEPSQHEQRKRQKAGDGDAVEKVPALPPSGRTGVAPPPTANIPSKQSQPGPRLPTDSSRPISWAGSPNSGAGIAGQPIDGVPGEEFAPNAFATPSRPQMVSQPSQQYAANGPKWYDRIMDVILGEDETQAKNRLVLICQGCRLVNGQAPPGAKTLEDVGTWRCNSCHAWNGIESEEKKVLKHAARREQTSQSPPTVASDLSSIAKPLGGDYEHVGKDLDQDTEEEGEQEGDKAGTGELDAPPAGSARSKARQRRKP